MRPSQEKPKLLADIAKMKRELWTKYRVLGTITDIREKLGIETLRADATVPLPKLRKLREELKILLWTLEG